MVSAFQPGIVGTSIARLVLPHADGNAPAMYFDSPSGFVSFKISMCSASQPSSRAIAEAIRLHTEGVGHRPTGWYTGRCSVNTVRLTAEQGAGRRNRIGTVLAQRTAPLDVESDEDADDA